MPLPLIPGVPDFLTLGAQLGWSLPPNLALGNQYLCNFTNVDGGFAHDYDTGLDYCFSPWPEDILGVGAYYTDGYNPTNHPVQAMWVDGQSCSNGPASPLPSPPTAPAPVIGPSPAPAPIVSPAVQWGLYCDGSGNWIIIPTDSPRIPDLSWTTVGMYSTSENALQAAQGNPCLMPVQPPQVSPWQPQAQQTACPPVCTTPLQVVVNVRPDGQTTLAGQTADASNAVGIEQPAAYRFEQRQKPWFRDAVAWMLEPEQLLINSSTAAEFLDTLTNRVHPGQPFEEWEPV